MTSEPPGLAVPPRREGRRRVFNEADKRLIVQEATRPGASLSQIARRYGIAARLLFRWKQELTMAQPAFFSVAIADEALPVEGCTP